MKNPVCIFLRLLCLVVCINAFAQETPQIARTHFDDSINNILKKAQNDSSKLRIYYNVCNLLHRQNRFKDQLQYAYRAIAFADSVKCKESLTLAKIRYLMCWVFNAQVTDLNEAFEQELKIKATADSLKDSLLLTMALEGMGLSEAYLVKDRNATAFKYYKEALLVAKRINSHSHVMNILSLMGNAYFFSGDTTNAIKAFRECIMLGKINNQGNGAVGTAFNNIGNLFDNLGQKDSALSYYRSAEGIERKIENSELLAVVLQNIGNILVKSANTYNTGLDTLLLAAKIGMRANNPYYSSDISKSLYLLYKSKGNLKNALFWKEKSDSLDGLFRNAELQQKIMSYQISSSVEQWKQKEGLLQAKKDVGIQAQIKRQELIKNVIIAALIIALVLAFYILNRYRLIRAQKELIEKQKHEVDKAYDIVDNKNSDILASIRYARRIQNALLIPPESLSNFFSEHFILYLPRDIVSGDFYWSAQMDGKLYLATADCTGHGVPGAFMSLLGNSFLNEIVLVRKITRPDLVLNELRKKVTEALNPKSSHEETWDGMDMVFCCFDLQYMQLSYAAANNPVWIVRKNDTDNVVFTESEYDKFPVGKFIKQDEPFRHFTLQLHPGDTIYTFTDGYRDQFGGAKGKRIGKKGFRDFIISLYGRQMNEQAEMLRSNFNEWKGDKNEQVDDICIIGLRV